MTDPYVGKLTYFRVYSGKLEKGGRVLNVKTGKTERIGRLLMMHANSREEIDECYAGDICAGVGLKETWTGDTLAAPDAPIVLENIEFPETGDRGRDRAKDKGRPGEDGDRPQRLGEEDPTFQVETDEETGQTLIHGMGELHLEVIVDRMLREFKVDANVGKPQVAYRETIRKEVKNVEARFVRQTGGRGQFGHVVINLEPAPGEGFRSSTKSRARHPGRIHRAGRTGNREALENGVKAGYPMVDVRVELSTAPTTTSTPRRWRSKSPARWRSRMPPARRTRSCSSRDGGRGRDSRGLPRRRDRRSLAPPRQGPRPGQRGNALAVQAFVPLGEMFGYATELRSSTQGRATYTMQFELDQEVPASIAEEIVEHRSGEPVGAAS